MAVGKAVGWAKSVTRTTWSYAFDYTIIAVFIFIFFLVDKIDGFHQPFSLNNYTLHYPFAKKELITAGQAIWICVFVPFLIIALYTLVLDAFFSRQPSTRSRFGRITDRTTLKTRLWQFHMAALGLVLSASAAFTITGSLKNAIGKPRPDLIDRCQPAPGSRDPLPYGLSNSTICTQPDRHILQDGFRSFPSGHSSTAFAGLYYLSLFLAGRLHVLDTRGEVWRTLIVLIPTLAAALVAGTRIMDARHHPFDVLSGALLGILTAWGAYRQYFPAVTNPLRKGRAYDRRTWPRPGNGDDESGDDRSSVDGSLESEQKPDWPGNTGNNNNGRNDHDMSRQIEDGFGAAPVEGAGTFYRQDTYALSQLNLPATRPGTSATTAGQDTTSAYQSSGGAQMQTSYPAPTGPYSSQSIAPPPRTRRGTGDHGWFHNRG